MEPKSASAVADPPVSAPAATKKKKSYPKKERNSWDHTPAQPKNIKLPPLKEKAGKDDLPRNTNLVQSVESPLDKEQLEALKFNEDPISIVITPESGKFAPKYVECWVNGRGIEVLIGNRWHEFKAIPVGKVVVTKRKYVEVFLRQKRMDIEHKEKFNPQADDYDNEIARSEALVHGITIRHDPAGAKGAEWFARLIQTGV